MAAVDQASLARRDHLWQQILLPRTAAEAVRVLGPLVGALLVAAALWAAGVFGPRLAADALGFHVDEPSGATVLAVRLTNRGLVPAGVASVMPGQDLGVTAVRPQADWAPTGFRDLRLRPGESRRVELVLAGPCRPDRGERITLRMVGYGPTGGTEVTVPFAAPPGCAPAATESQ